MQYVGVCECQIDNHLLGKKIKFSKTILVNIISKSLNSSVRELYAKHQKYNRTSSLSLPKGIQITHRIS